MPARSTLVGLALFLVGGSLLFPFLAGDMPTQSSPPPVAEPVSGDSGTYRWASSEGPEEGMLHFRWIGPITQRVADGSSRTLDGVEVTVRAGPSTVHNFTLAYETNESQPTTVTSEVAWVRNATLGASPELGWNARTETRYRSYTPPDPPAWSCLLAHGWQGIQPDQASGGPARPPCRAFSPSPGPADPLGTRTILGHQAYGYLVEDQGTDETLTLWFAPGIAYPLEANVSSAEKERSYQLVRLETGNGTGSPTTPGRDVGSEPLEPSTGPRPRWGVLVEDPSFVPYSPEAAIQAVQQDPTLDGFHGYLDDHPDAQVVAYAYYHTQRYVQPRPTEERVWTFLFNTREGDGYHVRSRMSAPVEADPDVDLALPGVDNHAEPRELTPLGPVGLPAVIVHLEDTENLWRQLTGNGSSVNTVFAVFQRSLENQGFCAAAGEPCIVVGHAAHTRTDEMVDATGRLTVAEGFSGLVADAATGEAEASYATSYRAGVGVEPAGSGSPGIPTVPSTDDGLPAPAVWWLGGGIASLLLYLARHPVLRFLAVLFHRLDDRDALENELRSRLLEIIRDDPGIHASEVRRRAGCGQGTLQYHLQVLVDAGFVVKLRVGGYKRLFEAGSMPADEMHRLGVLKGGSATEILAIVKSQPGMTQREIADRLGIDEAAIHRTLEKMEAVDLVTRVRDGRSISVAPGVHGGIQDQA